VASRGGFRAALTGAAGHTVVVAWYPELAIAVTSPAAEEARRVLRAYFDDVASRYYGRPATADEIAAAMSEDPSDDLAPPRGLLLVAQERGDVLGCAGLRLLPGHAAEVTRVFVVPAARRRGLASRLLDCLEEHARRHQVSVLRLDTRRDLIEARRLYARHGYREVAPFSSGPHADHWFEKALS
jgi:ribosomal protein S18 acetylase RimI-like enzyme